VACLPGVARKLEQNRSHSEHKNANENIFHVSFNLLIIGIRLILTVRLISLFTATKTSSHNIKETRNKKQERKERRKRGRGRKKQK
jgi:hypothetical protein